MLRLKAVLVKYATEQGVNIMTANICVSFGDEDEYSNARTVIDICNLAEKCFTTKYLFVTNGMRAHAADYEDIDK